MKFILIIIFLISNNIFAVDKLENPLSLKTAINIAINNSLIIKQLVIKHQLARNKLANVLAIDNININFNAIAEKKENYSSDNTHLSLLVNKNLYNQSNIIKTDSAKAELDIIKQQLIKEKIQQEIIVTEIFFSVLLSDLKHQAIVEKLAIFAVKENRIKDKYELSVPETADLDLLAAKNNTQLVLTELNNVEAKQITTRANLARIIGLDFDNDLDELKTPELAKYMVFVTKDFKDIKNKIINNNLNIKINNNNITNIKNTIKAERNNKEIKLNSYLKIGHNSSSENNINGDWKVGIIFNMPFGSNIQSIAVDRLNIILHQQQNLLQQQENTLVQQALELWYKLKTLKQQQSSLAVQLEYRDFYLERARANYELDLKSDIGDAMYKYTNTEYLIAKTNFNIIIIIKKLKLLTGDANEN